jgi:hypothetical protein
MPAMDADDAEMGVEDLSDEEDGAPMTHWGARLMGHAQAERAAAAMRMRGFDFEGGGGGGGGDDPGDDAAIPSPSGVGDVQRGQRRTEHLRRQRQRQRQRVAAAHRAQAEAAAKRQQRAAAGGAGGADEAEHDLRAAEPVRHRPINAAAAAAQQQQQQPQRNIGWRRIAAQSGPGAHAGGVIRWAVDCRLADDPLLLGMPLTDYDARLSAPTFFEMLGVPEPGERDGNAAETDDSQSEAVLQEQLKQAYAVTALRTRRCARGSTTLMSVAPSRYRALSKQLHPDKAAQQGARDATTATKDFQLLNLARDTLARSKSRHKYLHKLRGFRRSAIRVPWHFATTNIT